MDNELEIMIVVTQNETKLKARRPPYFMINAIHRAPSLPCELVMKKLLNKLRDGNLRLR